MPSKSRKNIEISYLKPKKPGKIKRMAPDRCEPIKYDKMVSIYQMKYKGTSKYRKRILKYALKDYPQMSDKWISDRTKVIEEAVRRMRKRLVDKGIIPKYDKLLDKLEK